jgi:hypothetical protein
MTDKNEAPGMIRWGEAKVKDLDLRPGDVLLLQIKGFVGKMVWLMQLINKDTSKWTHAAVVLDDDTVFEAQPGGSVITPLSEYADRPGIIVNFYQEPVPGGGWRRSRIEDVIQDNHRAGIVRDARAMHKRGYRYAWATYLYLALIRFGVRTDWLRAHVQDPDAGICSQAADLLLADNTIHLFADGRMPYDVTPGDLATLA